MTDENNNVSNGTSKECHVGKIELITAENLKERGHIKLSYTGGLSKHLPMQVDADPPAGARYTTILSSVPEGDGYEAYGPAYFDFDAAYLNDAARDCLGLIETLVSNFSVPVGAFQLFASGGKGFHLIIPLGCFAPGEAITGEQSKYLHQIYKELALALSDGKLESLDFKVYTKRRMFRLVNVQRENGRYKVPLTLTDLRNIDSVNYSEFCSKPRPAIPVTPYFSEKLSELFEQVSDKVISSIKAREAERLRRQALPKNTGSGAQKLEVLRFLQAAGNLDFDDRDVWLKAGMALSDAEDSSLIENGYQLWESVSSKSTKFDEKTQESTWDGFSNKHEGLVTLSSIYYLAKQAGWQDTAALTVVERALKEEKLDLADDLLVTALAELYTTDQAKALACLGELKSVKKSKIKEITGSITTFEQQVKATARQAKRGAKEEQESSLEARKGQAIDKVKDFIDQHCLIFRGDDDNIYARAGGQAYLIQTEAFKARLLNLMLKEKFERVSELAIETALKEVAASALDFEPQPTARRVTKKGDLIFIDTGNTAGDVIQISEEGWSCVPVPDDVFFVRYMGMSSLPDLPKTGDIDLLWRFVNVAEEDRLLVLAWLLECFRSDTPFPILEFLGNAGDGKTSSTQKLVDLIDPRASGLEKLPKNEEELIGMCAGMFLLPVDNSGLAKYDLQDRFCQIATGATFATRELYTTVGRRQVKAHAPVILNGVIETGSRPDYLSRLVRVRMKHINPSERMSSATLTNEWTTAYPQVLAGLLDLLVKVLQTVDSVKLDSAPRLADFAALGEALGIVLGHPSGVFLSRFTEMQRLSFQQSVSDEPVVAKLLEKLKNHIEKSATAGEWAKLISGPGNEVSARAFSATLARFSDLLIEVGWKLSKTQERLGTVFTFSKLTREYR